MSINKPSALAKLYKHHWKWNVGANCLQFLNVSLGFVAIGASLMVASFTSELGDFYTRIFAFVSALAFGPDI